MPRRTLPTSSDVSAGIRSIRPVRSAPAPGLPLALPRMLRRRRHNSFRTARMRHTHCAVLLVITPTAYLASGFCFLNNSAIAAAHLRLRHERVAILDVDVHHGNGTQGIFYERPDVLTVSIHADPTFFNPFVWGYAHERGAGSGLGATSTFRCRSARRTTATCRRSVRPKRPSVLLRLALWWSRSVSMLQSMIRSPSRRDHRSAHRRGHRTVGVTNGLRPGRRISVGSSRVNLTAALAGFEEAR